VHCFFLIVLIFSGNMFIFEIIYVFFLLPPAAAKKEKSLIGDPLLHPPDAQPRTPAKDFVLCTSYQ